MITTSKSLPQLYSFTKAGILIELISYKTIQQNASEIKVIFISLRRGTRHASPFKAELYYFILSQKYSAGRSVLLWFKNHTIFHTGPRVPPLIFILYFSFRFPGRQAQPQTITEQPFVAPQENIATTKQASRGRVHFNTQQVTTEDASFLVTASPIQTQPPRETQTRSKSATGNINIHVLLSSLRFFHNIILIHTNTIYHLVLN